MEDIVNKFLHRETARENLEAQMHVCREKIDILTAERKGLLHRLENVQTDRSHMGGRVVYQELENTNRRLAVVRVAARHPARVACHNCTQSSRPLNCLNFMLQAEKVVNTSKDKCMRVSLTLEQTRACVSRLLKSLDLIGTYLPSNLQLNVIRRR